MLGFRFKGLASLSMIMMHFVLLKFGEVHITFTIKLILTVLLYICWVNQSCHHTSLVRRSIMVN